MALDRLVKILNLLKFLYLHSTVEIKMNAYASLLLKWLTKNLYIEKTTILKLIFIHNIESLGIINKKRSAFPVLLWHKHCNNLQMSHTWTNFIKRPMSLFAGNNGNTVMKNTWNSLIYVLNNSYNLQIMY